MKSFANKAIMTLVVGALLLDSWRAPLTYTLMNAQLGGVNQKVLDSFRSRRSGETRRCRSQECSVS